MLSLRIQSRDITAAKRYNSYKISIASPMLLGYRMGCPAIRSFKVVILTRQIIHELLRYCKHGINLPPLDLIFRIQMGKMMVRKKARERAVKSLLRAPIHFLP